MRLKNLNAWARVCMLALFVILSATTLTAAPALALPEGRVYEMVSPLYKGGYGVLAISAVAPDGESVAYYSPGGFANAPSGAEVMDYIARRGASGWSTVPLMPPATLLSDVASRDVSSTLGLSLALGKPGSNNEGAFHLGTEEEFKVHPTDTEDLGAEWQPAGPVLTTLNKTSVTASYEGASADLCHLFVGTSKEPLAPEALESTEQTGLVYEVNRGCGGEPESVKVLGLNNSAKVINPACAAGLGTPPKYLLETQSSKFNAISADGSETFFESGVGNVCIPHQLFVRLDGARTLELSRPLEASEFGGCVGEVGGAPGEVPCAGAASRASANFVGASEDGSKVFFTSTLATSAKPLVPGDTDVSNNLYMATIGCLESEPGCEPAKWEVTSLIQVSHDPTVGKAAEVNGVVRVAPDGSRVYFVAHGDLLGQAEQEALESEGRPAPHGGADNLYVYDGAGSGKLTFIADLCSESEKSGNVEDLQCPSGLEGGAGNKNDANLWGSAREAQTNSCPPAHPSCEPGRFLLFSTYARLSVGDTNEAKDVYRYDADTGTLERVSVGEDGYNSNGNCRQGVAKSGGVGACDATIRPGHVGGSVRDQYEMDNRAISDDGTRIVFTTAEPLSPNAINGQLNAYEWHQGAGQGEGRVSLVSSGLGEPVEDVAISLDGRDIFFVTSEGLAPEDTDGAPDIYDARLGGGFPAAPVPAEPCKGDACQGPLTNPAPLLIPGSVSQAPGGNFAAPNVPVRSKKKTNTKKKPAKKKPKASGKKHNAKARRAGRTKAIKLGRGRS
jgi:hypothetical protein